MGKYKHEGKGRNISVGGGQERKDLFKDMSGGYNAMGDSNSPNYQYNGSAFKQRFSSPMEKQGPLHGNAFGHAMQKTGGDYDKAKSMLEMKGSPMHKSPYKVIGDPNKKMDRLSAKHKSLYDRFEMGQTSEKEEQRMFRLEDRMDKVGKKIESKKSPLNQGVKKSGGSKTKYTKEIEKNNRADSDDVIKYKKQLIEQSKQKMLQTGRGKTTSTKKTMTTGRGKTTKSPVNQGKKVKKAAKTQAQIDKIRKSFGTKDADVSGRFERKRNKMDKTVRQLEKKGIKVDFDTTSAEGEGASRKTFVGAKKKKTMTTARGKTTKSPLNQGFDADAMFKTLPGGNYPKPPISGRNPNYKPGVKADEDRTKKDKRKHKRTMKKLGRLTKKIVLKSTSKK